jgi:hypothetical protein
LERAMMFSISRVNTWQMIAFSRIVQRTPARLSTRLHRHY